MKKSRLLGAVCACLSILSFNVNAAIVTQGFLTSNDDGSSNIITDSLNNVEYLRLDVLADLTYAQTLAALGTQDGGGWSIASPTDALNFTAAALGGATACAHDGTSVTSFFCGYMAGWSDGEMGDDYNSTVDLAWFLDESGDADFLQFNESNGRIDMYPTNLLVTDDFSSSGDAAATPVSWLVVRPASAVPVPPAAWLFGSGLLGIIGVARRKVRA